DVLRLGQAEIVVVGEMATSFPPAPEMIEEAPAPPPPPKPVLSRLEPAVRLAKRIFGAAYTSEPTFPSYTELPYRMPRPLWHGIRAVSVAAYVALCVGLFVRPAGGLFWFFKVIIPLLPILFFVAPGLWR